VIMTSMTTALTQCMILRGQGCSRRPMLVGDACIKGDSFGATFMKQSHCGNRHVGMPDVE
jgi:hypothetical protein